MNTKIKTLLLASVFTMSHLIAQTDSNKDLLELPGDNLDLYATLDLFQKSKTIEEFEKALNDEDTGINNLDLDLDGNVDFIKVTSQQDGDDFTFVLQVDIQKEETQDVAAIFVSKDKDAKVSIQMVGDENLYGKDYIIEPKLETTSVTANPAYSGPDTIVVKNEAATVVVLESEPIVHYVYSPMYVPYYPPYYYGYYPPYYRPYPVISINIYFGRHRHHHHHYHGGHRGGNTVIINNNTTYNNYNRTKNTSNTVNRNKKEGNYKANKPSNHPASGTKNNKVKPTNNQVKNPTNNTKAKPATKPANKPAAKPASKPAARPKKNVKRR